MKKELVSKQIIPTEKVVQEKPNEPIENENVMDEVIKACNFYKNAKYIIAELDEIIDKSQKLKEMLGGVFNG